MLVRDILECGTYERDKKCLQYFGRKLERKRPLGKARHR